jgi:hypothetical protein
MRNMQGRDHKASWQLPNGATKAVTSLHELDQNES